MKIYNKLIALVAAFGLVGVSYAQDEAAGGNLTDNISIAGFVDASFQHTENSGTETETIGIDHLIQPAAMVFILPTRGNGG